MAELADGTYEQLITDGVQRRLTLLEGKAASREPLDPADAHELLARHVADLARRALRSVAREDRTGVLAQVELANRIARAIVKFAPEIDGQEDFVASPGDLLYAIAQRTELPGLRQFPPRPEVPLSASALLVNGRGQPRIGSEVNLELASADRVDLLCTFVKFHGVRVLEQQIAALTSRGGKLRVITTTYMGATELAHFLQAVRRRWHYWLNRRSQKRRWTWERFTRFLRARPLPLPIAVHSTLRHAANP